MWPLREFKNISERSPFSSGFYPMALCGPSFYRQHLHYLVRFPDYADFEVSLDGLSVCCWPVEQVLDEIIQHIYLNQVYPLALSKQNVLVFHASAVEIAGSCIAFMGIAGRGKSTLAASFAANGFPFLSDDGLILGLRGSVFEVLPSHPSIRLWEDSETAILESEKQASVLSQHYEKNRFMAGDQFSFCSKPMPLSRVYFLGEGDRTQISCSKISAREAHIELVKHSFLIDVGERALLSSQFKEISRLLQQVSFYHLDYPRCYQDLAELRKLDNDSLLERPDIGLQAAWLLGSPPVVC